ncbi:unnamed protein product [Paramecium octaurelia]|uniref:Uncharacterized protein n=1 Tax=Paramecium octaurelia TaxID=43137 RepID=A0A8S1VQ28_PAROT|nr:unnamed protein product [Paramecium octaurelia]
MRLTVNIVQILQRLLKYRGKFQNYLQDLNILYLETKILINQKNTSGIDYDCKQVRLYGMESEPSSPTYLRPASRGYYQIVY